MARMLAAWCLTTLLLAGPARASEVELLRWEAPVGCPSREVVHAEIEKNLGRALAVEDAAAVRAEGHARRRGDGRWELALTISVRGAEPASRVVRAKQCGLLAEAAALLVAVAIDPGLLGGEVEEIAAEPGSREVRGVPMEVTVREPQGARGTGSAGKSESESRSGRRGSESGESRSGRRGSESGESRSGRSESESGESRSRTVGRESVGSGARRGVRFAAAGAVGVDVGALPGAAVGLGLRVGVLTRWVRVELGALQLLTRRARVADTQLGGDVRLAAGQLRVCPRVVRGRFEVPLCAGLELGAMRGAGVGLVRAAVDRVVWLAVVGDARMVWSPAPRVGLGVELGLAAPLLEASFDVTGLAAPLHKAAPVAFRGGLAVELRFP